MHPAPCFLAVLTLPFCAKLPLTHQLLQTCTHLPRSHTWLSTWIPHPENHLGPSLHTQPKERAGPTPSHRQKVGSAHRSVSHTHMQSIAVGHRHPDHYGQSLAEALGYEQTGAWGHTQAHLRTITRAHQHAHRHLHCPILRHPAQVPSQASTLSPSPTPFQKQVGRAGV